MQAGSLNQQGFIGHSDSVTGLAWADAQTLISTGAGDAVIVWRRTPAALPRNPPATNPDSRNPHAISLSDLGSSVHAVVALDSQPANPPTLAVCSPAVPIGHSIQPSTVPASHEASLALTYHTPAQPASAVLVIPDATTLHAAANVVLPLTLDAAQQDTAGLGLLSAAQTAATAGAAAVAAEAMAADFPPHGADSDAEAAAVVAVTSTQPCGASCPESSRQTDPRATGLEVDRVIGFNGDAPGVCVWLEKSSKLVYAAGCMLIEEDLATREQR